MLKIKLEKDLSQYSKEELVNSFRWVNGPDRNQYLYKSDMVTTLMGEVKIIVYGSDGSDYEARLLDRFGNRWQPTRIDSRHFWSIAPKDTLQELKNKVEQAVDSRIESDLKVATRTGDK